LSIYEGKDFENEFFNLKTKLNMKNKSSFYHSTLAFAYVLLVAVIFCGCDNTTQNETMAKEQDLFKFGIQTISHDGCEYIMFKDIGSSDVEMLHKQNCKFCADRSKK
jgi:hypothetical protein